MPKYTVGIVTRHRHCVRISVDLSDLGLEGDHFAIATQCHSIISAGTKDDHLNTAGHTSYYASSWCAYLCLC